MVAYQYPTLISIADFKFKARSLGIDVDIEVGTINPFVLHILVYGDHRQVKQITYFFQAYKANLLILNIEQATKTERFFRGLKRFLTGRAI
jgi:hypothetical protein